MTAEEIRLIDVLQVIYNSQIIENYPHHRRGACCLLHGFDAYHRDIHVVCTTTNVMLCGDILFTPETVRRIEVLLADLPEPVRTVPLFEYA